MACVILHSWSQNVPRSTIPCGLREFDNQDSIYRGPQDPLLIVSDSQEPSGSLGPLEPPNCVVESPSRIPQTETGKR